MRNCRVITILSAMVLFSASTRASVLIFEPVSGNLAGSSTPLQSTTYGDNISADVMGNFKYSMGNGYTPNATVNYSASHSTDTAATGIYYRATFGGSAILLTSNTDNTVAANRKFYITFTPDFASIGIRLNSFELKDFAGFQTGDQTVTWTVYNTSVLPGNVLATNTVTWSDGGAVPVNTGLTSFITSSVLLEIRHDAGARQDLYIDNINFDQIPEPGAAAVALVAVVPLMLRRTRHRPSQIARRG